MKIVYRLIYFFVFLLVIYKIATGIVPDIVDKGKNKVILAAPYQVSAQTQKVHDNIPFVADLHCDVLLWDRDITEREDFGHVDIPRMQASNMALQAFTIVSKSPVGLNFESNDAESFDNITLLGIAQGRPIKYWFSLKERALYQCQKLYDAAEDSQGSFRVITSASDLQQYINDRSENKSLTAGYLGAEGAHILEKDINNVQTMYDAGLRMMGPVHFFDNAVGGSAHGIQKGGLTEFGKEVIQKMESLSMIVDLAHASPKLIDDVLAIAKRPLLVSHAGVKGTCDNVRTLSDSHLRQIADGGGLLGVAMFGKAVCGNTAKATAKTVKYIIDLVGIDHVALGSDFDGAVATHFDVTGLVLLTEQFVSYGYNQDQINQIMGGNIQRFLLEQLPKE